MSRNDALDFAQRLYARLPAHYRVYDQEQGLPLFALCRVVGEQAANLRQDLDVLWDNFFIETCDDWVVPYIGALTGANLLQQPVGQSNRLAVWNTVMFRRSKGTPQMLQALAESVSEWPVEMTEFFRSLGWSQNMNHVRLDRPLTPSLRDPVPLGLLGRARDPLAHAADFHPRKPLSEPVARAGTEGLYQIKNLGFFVRRLQTFPTLRGATPAAAAPGLAPAAGNASFSFNPLFRDVPLFSLASGGPLTRTDFGARPWDSFGDQGDVAVRQFGILLAADSPPVAVPSAQSLNPFTFGNAGTGLTLDAASGLRLMRPREFQLGSAHFVITAQWRSGATTATLGSLSTRTGFATGPAAPGAGQLVLQIALGSGSPPARFPATIIAIRAKSNGAARLAEALYAYLPAQFINPASGPVSFFIAEDGSSYTTPTPASANLARAAEGQIFPPRQPNHSTRAAQNFSALARQPNAMVLTDPSRFGGLGVVVRAALFTGQNTFQTLGGIATVSQPSTAIADLQVPNPWPPLTFAPATAPVGSSGPKLLAVRVQAITGTFIPSAELVVTNRAGDSLLICLPEVAAAAAATLLVADDGATYFAPTDPGQQSAVLAQGSLSGLVLARASQGQSLPIPGVWPLQQRRPVAINLCSPLRNSLLAPGELGIDPELGRFALPPGDPALPFGNLTVDHVEAFAGPVGAHTFDRELDTAAAPNRLVANSGDADSASGALPVHATLAAAVAAAKDGDIIEIADSATYASAPIAIANAAVKSLTIRAAAGERPCFVFQGVSSISVTVPMTSLILDGLLISGGPVVVSAAVAQLNLTSCTLDPESSAAAMLVSSDANLNSGASYVLAACITGGIALAAGVAKLTIADSIVDAKSGAAIAAHRLQIERVTVFGTIACDVLEASECLLNDAATVQDRQSGCVRFTRFEAGSILPRRYQSIPSDERIQAWRSKGRCVSPAFRSRKFGRPGYAQLTSASAPEILTASESGAEVGVFASRLNTIRLRNLQSKLQEFMPVGLTAVVIAET